MAKNVTIAGASYSNVPAIKVPLTSDTSSYATFSDVSSTTATPSDVASGKTFFNSQGVETAGTLVPTVFYGIDVTKLLSSGNDVSSGTNNVNTNVFSYTATRDCYILVGWQCGTPLNVEFRINGTNASFAPRSTSNAGFTGGSHESLCLFLKSGQTVSLYKAGSTSLTYAYKVYDLL